MERSIAYPVLVVWYRIDIGLGKQETNSTTSELVAGMGWFVILLLLPVSETREGKGAVR